MDFLMSHGYISSYLWTTRGTEHRCIIVYQTWLCINRRKGIGLHLGSMLLNRNMNGYFLLKNIIVLCCLVNSANTSLLCGSAVNGCSNHRA